MKCKVCGGTGTSNTCVNGTFKPCSFCDGTGEYEPFDADVELDKLDSKPMTNEEWFCGLSTLDKAEQFAKIYNSGISAALNNHKDEDMNYIIFWEKWLKEKHYDR